MYLFTLFIFLNYGLKDLFYRRYSGSPESVSSAESITVFKIALKSIYQSNYNAIRTFSYIASFDAFERTFFRLFFAFTYFCNKITQYCPSWHPNRALNNLNI